MTTENILYALEIFSILAGAAFGIIGVVTETKDKNEKLTPWGLMAIVGIVATNSFSLLNNHYKQKHTSEDKIASQKKENDELRKQKTEYEQQLGYLTSILGKADTSLQKIGENIEGQREVLSQSKLISARMSILYPGFLRRNPE